MEEQDTIARKACLPRARAFALALCQIGHRLGCSLTEVCRKANGHEAVSFVIRPNVPQKVTHDIRYIEPIEVVFTPADASHPEVLSLRPDFPDVVHLNARQLGAPASLCLTEQPWSEARRTWNPVAFLMRLRWWLEQSATDMLHRETDVLHHFMGSSACAIVLTTKQLEELSSTKRYGLEVRGEDIHHPLTMLLKEATAAPPGAPNQPLEWVLFPCVTEPAVQKGLRYAPSTVRQLCDLIHEETGTDLRVQILKGLEDHFGNGMPGHQGPKVILLVCVPVARERGGPVERQVYPFLAPSARQLGIDVCFWHPEGGRRLAFDPLRPDWGTRAELLAVSFQRDFEPELAVKYSGHELLPSIVVVGAGALGSQVAEVIARGGCERVGIIDKDFLLPHNLGRHTLEKNAVGFAKAKAVAHVIESATATPTAYLLADILDSGNHSKITEFCAGVALLVDCSASSAVSSALHHIAPASARRVTCFLNPTGSDLVLMIEGRDRSFNMAELEDNYLAFVAQDDRLADHLPKITGRARFGRGCGDQSTQMAPELVLGHAATAARMTRRLIQEPLPALLIFRTTDDGDSARLNFEIARSRALQVQLGWSINILESVLEACRRERKKHLPNETGGVLLGTWDVERRELRIVTMVPAPKDSLHSRDGFVRGSDGLRECVEFIIRRTGGQVVYLGEWHSHPRGASAAQSATDIGAVAILADELAAEGKPAVQLIVADGEKLGVTLGLIQL